ncbi:MAG: NAD-dependent epimerase/dehydratase family protein, partial [Chloroflexota bacterium]
YADAVVHLGALVGDPACALDESLTIDINLAATRAIAEAAKGLGIERFVFASTCSVYGASNQVLNEQSALNPVSLYARTKIAAEQILLSMSDHRFAPVILRFGTIYGLSPRPRFDLVVNLLAARAVQEKSITIQGGEQWRPFVHVDDVATAIIKCIEAPLDTVRGEIFNVGSDDQNYRIAQIGDIISTIVPGVEVVKQGEVADLRNYRVSFAKIRRTLGFIPRHTVASGVLEIKAAIESGQISEYQDMRYSNHKTLSESTLVELSQGAGVLSLERYRMQFLDELKAEKAKTGNHQTLPLAG